MTLKQAIAAAQPGDVIDWTGKPAITGDFKNVTKPVTVRGATFGKARLLGCSDLTFDGFRAEHLGDILDFEAILGVERCQNVTLRHGEIVGGLRRGYGLKVAGGSGTRVEDLFVTTVKRGVVIAGTTDAKLHRLVMDDLRSDGVNISASSLIEIDGLEVRKIEVEGTEHPDVVQIINEPGATVPSSDITIRNVRAKVNAQGICLFDHGRGGADRILIENVDLLVSLYHGINMENVRGLTLRNIKVGALPGTPAKIKPWVKTTGSTDVVTENVVTGWDGGVKPERPSPFTAEQEARIRQIVRELAA